MTVENIPISKDIKFILNDYRRHQLERGYSGIPDDLLNSLLQRHGEGFHFLLLKAYVSHPSSHDSYLGFLLTLTFNGTTTYLIGSTNARGRKLQANTLLLWRSILDAQAYGSSIFDLGGLGTGSASSISQFKLGTNPNILSFIGDWIF